MAKKLTAQQEAFAFAVFQGMSYAGAYRNCYNTLYMGNETIHTEASRLANNPKITARINELRAELKSEVLSSSTDLLAELEEARLLALRHKNPNGMTTATMAKAKLLGMLKEIKAKGQNQDETE
ncbi:terminase small subunit [Testudinibacter sp. P80/BLE/0925]|uniref:terminase small subunit n=1 Tax=Testudinibacter sp. TW-1 TaxID=3417757 RepID=UPI003D365D32